MYEARADEPALILTLKFDPQGDGVGEVRCYNIGGESLIHFKAHERTTISDIKSKIAYKLKESFRLVTCGGADLSKLPGYAVVTDLEVTDDSALGALELADADEPLPSARVRNLKRKRPNARQHARKPARRMINKHKRKAEQQHSSHSAPKQTAPSLMASKPKAPPPVSTHALAM